MDKNSKKPNKNRPSAKNKVWANMTQLMILLNGTILTLTAFITLTIFVDKRIENEYNEALSSIHRDVSQATDTIKQNVHITASLIDAVDQRNLDPQSLDIPFTLNHSDYFDYLVWLEPQENGSYIRHSLLKEPNYGAAIHIDDIFNAQLYDYLNETVEWKSLKKDAYISIDFPAAETNIENDNPRIIARPFAIVQKVNTQQNGEAGYIVGISRLSRVLDTYRVNKEGEVSRIVVEEARSGKRLYSMSRSSNENDYILRLEAGHILQKSFTLHAGDKLWTLHVEVDGDTSQAFMNAIPYLLLLFGMTFTLLGTLYVRNNQKNALRLAMANSMLEGHNENLSSEVVESKRLNEALEKAEFENRKILNSINDVIFEVDQDGKFTFLNKSWRKLTSFDIQGTIDGENILNLVYPEDQAAIRKGFLSLPDSKEKSFRIDTKMKISDGRYRNVSISVSYSNLDNRYIGTISDIEDSARARRALDEAEKKYKTIVENISGGIYQITPEGQFLSLNPSLARILGYERPEEAIRHIYNFHDQYVDGKARNAFIKRVTENGLSRNFETQLRKADGEIVWILESARAVLDNEGEVHYYEGSVEDITEQKKVEIALRDAKTQSDLSNRAKTEFLTNMSHELRTPLNAIIGFSEIIKNEVFGPIGQKAYWEYARDIYDSGNRLLKIINEILDVSKIEAGERTLNENVVNICKLVSSSLNLMGAKIEEQDIRINNTLNEDKVCRIIGEDISIKQMIMNILSNAIKFTARGGTVTIAGEMDEMQQFRLSITDTGIGMNEDEVEKALSPFGQIDSALSRQGTGTGLGLTLVDSLIKLHGGSIEIFSEKGIGTTVTLIFPAKRVVPNEKAAAEDKEPAKPLTAADLKVISNEG